MSTEFGEEEEEEEVNSSELPDGMKNNPDRSIQIDDGPDASADDSLPAVFRSFFDGVVYSHGGESQPLIRRVKDAASEHAPRLRDASRNSAANLIAWTRRGSALRHLFVISVGSIALISLTGVLVFMAFLAALTVNSVVISLLMSLAAFGGFLAIFFALLTAIYVGALSVAIFVISAATISTIIAISIVSGWVGLFLMVWIIGKKSLDLTKQSIDLSCSAVSAYSSSRQRRDS
ncbi:hypothetical protein LUZ60_003170 [Juncus effusus]|nr:hypothetical protein LUZ60_003170 [Juncus effusus]